MEDVVLRDRLSRLVGSNLPRPFRRRSHIRILLIDYIGDEVNTLDDLDVLARGDGFVVLCS